MMVPRRLPRSAVIGVCSLSGRVDGGQLSRGTARLRELGHQAVIAPHALDTWRYFAGKDEERVSGFEALLEDKSIDMIMSARGGYGLSRVLPLIDWKQVAESGKIFAGFSDFTAFNCAAYALGNLVTFQAPMVASDFSGETPNAFAQENFWKALSSDSHRIEDIASEHGYSPQVIEGPLWGGNVSLLAHLVGTPYFPRIEDGILYVEEIGEDPYAIERMFVQLLHAGVLAKQRALILADFTDCKPNNPERYPYSMDEVVESLREWLPYPVLTGLPFGHVARKLTLPFGAPGTLTITESGFGLAFSGHVR